METIHWRLLAVLQGQWRKGSGMGTGLLGLKPGWLMMAPGAVTGSTTVNRCANLGWGVVNVAEQLKDREPGKVLSIYSYTPFSLDKLDSATGQNTPLFFKLFDRVYYPTDRGTYVYNLQDVTRSISEEVAASRFVPVVENYLPDNPDKISWVLIDKEE